MKPYLFAAALAMLSAGAATAQTIAKETTTDTSGNATSATSSSSSPSTGFRLDWDANPKPHKVADSLRKYSAALVVDERQLHYKAEGDEVYVYRTMHRVFRMFDAKGVESFNTLTIQVGDGRSMERLKARTILPDGRVIKVSQDKIKVTKSEQGVPQYLIAFEGVEKDAEVEYFFTEKRPLSVFGSESIQWSIPVTNTSISFIVPERMKFEFKGYNGFPAPKTDSVKEGKRVYHVSTGLIPPLEEEEYSNYQANLMRLDYKLSYLSDNEFTRLFTWDDLAKRLYENYYSLSSREEKTISRYLESIGVADSDDELVKIRKIEEAVKSGIVLSEDVSSEEYAKFDVIIQKKLTTEQGFTRFMVACLQLAGVRNQLGLTSTYSEHPLDEAFENWNALDHYIVYLPKQKGFLDPANPYTRYPVLPTSLLSNKGIFRKISGSGKDVSTGAIIRTINTLSMEETNNGIDADISFVSEDLSPEIHIKHSFTGYSSLGLRPIFAAISKDKTKELVTQFISVAEKPEDISTYKVHNKAMSDYATNTPLIIDATVKAPHLMEKAGPKYLFKLGDVIGRQTEMYNDNKRTLPIHMEYPHTFIRHLNITIPEGYAVKNPEAVRFNVVHKTNGSAEGIGFISDYEMKGNIMTVTIREYYREIDHPISEYEPFRKVINAAADFNKVVLVLEKK